MLHQSSRNGQKSICMVGEFANKPPMPIGQINILELFGSQCTLLLTRRNSFFPLFYKQRAQFELHHFPIVCVIQKENPPQIEVKDLCGFCFCNSIFTLFTVSIIWNKDQVHLSESVCLYGCMTMAVSFNTEIVTGRVRLWPTKPTHSLIGNRQNSNTTHLRQMNRLQ